MSGASTFFDLTGSDEVSVSYWLLAENGSFSSACGIT
jgi:hypothetical protein